MHVIPMIVGGKGPRADRVSEGDGEVEHGQTVEQGEPLGARGTPHELFLIYAVQGVSNRVEGELGTHMCKVIYGNRSLIHAPYMYMYRTVHVHVQYSTVHVQYSTVHVQYSTVHVHMC